MTHIDDYITATLMRDLVGHDHRPASFLVYLWLTAEQQRRRAPIRISYQELAESVGISKSSTQSAVAWLIQRKLLTAAKPTATATPTYTVQAPWSPRSSKESNKMTRAVSSASRRSGRQNASKTRAAKPQI